MPSQILSVLNWLSGIATVAMFGYIVLRYARSLQTTPCFTKPDVVFQEWFASGCSQKNIITKIGGARNCLRLVVTGSFLWVTSWFPFSLIAPFYDMEHVIPLRSITSVRRDRFFGRLTFLVTFTANNGASRSLRLAPKNPDAFAHSLGVKIDHGTSA
jgi:hypothetical protein